MRDRLKHLRWIATPLLFYIATLSLPEILLSSSVASTQEATTGDRNLIVQAQTTQDRNAEALRLNEEGLQLLNKRQFREALEKFQKALVIVREIGERQGEGKILHSMGDVYRNLAQYPKALEFYQQALTIAGELKNRTAQGQTLYYMGESYRSLGQYQQALDSYQQALAIAQELKNRAAQGQTLNSIGEAYRSLGQEQQALESHQQALAIAHQAEAERLLEGWQSGGNQVQKALQSLRQALEIYRKLGDRYQEGNTLYSIGEVYRKLEQYPQALERYQQALAIAREIDFRLGEATILDSIGDVYYSLKQYPQTLEAYQQASEIYRTIGDHKREGETLHKLAGVYRSLKEYAKEIEILQQFLAIVKIEGSLIWNDEINTPLAIARAYHQLGQYSKEREYHQQALTVIRALNEPEQELSLLRRLGEIYRRQKQYPEALQVYQQVLDIVQKTPRDISDRKHDIDEALADAGWRRASPDIEVETLIDLSVVHHLLGQYQAESEYYQQALAVSRNISGREAEFVTTYRLASIYDNSLNVYSKAIELYQQALTLARTIDDDRAAIYPLLELGNIYLLVGPYQKAVESYQEAIDIYENIGSIPGTDNKEILNEIGIAYQRLGKYADAIQLYQQALNAPSWRGKNDQALVTNNLGASYRALGQYQKALDLHNQALTLAQDSGGWGGEFEEADALDNLGMTYQALGQYQNALKFHQQALEIFRQNDENRNEAAIALNNLGSVYQALGQSQNAIESHQQVLEKFQEIGNRGGEADALNNLGESYRSLEQYDRAMEFYQRSLAIKQEIGDRAGEGITLNNIGTLLAKQNQPELAIVFFKQSVNVRESIRSNIRSLSQKLQQSYTETVAGDYRRLADLLLQQNRVLEAQRVLDLLKVQELDDYLHNVRGNDQTVQGIETLPSEQQLLNEYTELQNQAIAIGTELAQLSQISEAQLTLEQQQRRNELFAKQGQIKRLFVEFTKRPDVVALVQQLSQTAKEQNLPLSRLTNISDNLKRLEQNAVLLYPLILEDRIELVLATPDSPPIRHTVPVKREQLNRVIAEFRQALEDPRRDAVTAARKLYEWLIKPLEDDLAAAKAETIIYAPDAQLRYIPLAALHDGKGWLVQRFQVNNITADSLTDFNTQPQKQLRVLAGAYTANGRPQSFPIGDRQFNFSGLRFAGQEVENLATMIPETTKLLDDQFSKTGTLPRMDNFSVVHFATHAALVRGLAEESFILFGNGDRVSMREVEEEWRMTNVDLIVLSACETGLGSELGNGEEILGFGYLMQTAGARAAIASLWSVSDGGTQALMNALYTALNNRVSAAVALRQAQIALITKDLSAVGGSRGEEAWIEVVSTRTGLPVEVSNNLSHPYYWAPFILIGNGL